MMADCSRQVLHLNFDIPHSRDKIIVSRRRGPYFRRHAKNGAFRIHTRRRTTVIATSTRLQQPRWQDGPPRRKREPSSANGASRASLSSDNGTKEIHGWRCCDSEKAAFNSNSTTFSALALLSPRRPASSSPIHLCFEESLIANEAATWISCAESNVRCRDRHRQNC